MVEGLEVVIKYRGAKYDQVASPKTASSEFAILKKDLAHLRVHSPSQKNVKRVNGSFVLHWPTAGMSQKIDVLSDTLHKRWFKLCSDDPEALKLREVLSIESITLMQDDVLIRSTMGAEQPSQDVPPGSLAERLSDPLPEIDQQPVPAPVPTYSVLVEPQPPVPPASPKRPPSAPRLDRQPPPHLKRRKSGSDGPSNQTRQKLDVPEGSTASPVQATQLQLQPQPQPQDAHLPTESGADRQLHGSFTPRDATQALNSQPPGDDASHSVQPPVSPTPAEPLTVEMLPPKEPGETTVSDPLNSGSGPRPPPLVAHASPPSYQSSSSSGNGDHHATSRRRERDVNRLTRELWDTRRQLTAVQAREQVILDDLERLGVRPEGGGASVISRQELLVLEAELRAERARRVRAERALSEVERECRAPFVVPALLQAFMSISELSS